MSRPPPCGAVRESPASTASESLRLQRNPTVAASPAGRRARTSLRSVSRAAILYDADCGFCKWCLAQVLRLDRERRLRPVALQSPEAEALLPGMDAEERMASWHLVMPDGQVSSAGAAFDP